MAEIKLSDYQKTILKLFAENDMNVSKMAREVPLHRNTCEYHLNTLQDITGKNLKCFYDLAELLPDVVKVKHGRWLPQVVLSFRGDQSAK